jgi:solute carrier family 35 protein F1/2
VVDVEANYLVTKAYQYTSLTSVTLLDCFTIPAVMVLSYCILRKRYQHAQYAAAAICIAGLTVLVASDKGSAEAGADPLRGDALVLLGATLYAVSNVLQERLLQDVPFQELLAMCGCFGAVISGVQVALLEHQAIKELPLGFNSIGPLAAFALALFMFYSLVPRVLIWGGATVLNLSLLSSDVWAAAARILLFGGFGGTLPMFSVSLVMVSGGICMYACCEEVDHEQERQEAGGKHQEGRGGAHPGVHYNVLRDPEAPLSPCHDESGPRDPSIELESSCSVNSGACAQI